MAAVARLAQAEAAGSAMAAALGVSGADELAAMRAVPADRIVAEADKLIGAGKFVASPNVDGWAQPDVPGRIFANGGQHAVPLLIGSNALEMTTLRYYLPRFERTAAGYQAWLQATSGPLAAKIQALYPAATDADVEPAAIRLTTDLFFSCPSRFAARAMEAAGMPAYLYQFTRVLPGGESLGAYHSAEIGYVFDTKQPWLPKADDDDRLTDLMGRYWTRFAATGDPNGDGLPEWPIHRAASDRSLELGSEVAVRTGLLKDACDIFDLGTRLQWGQERQ
jgi:para-nitrobenzyl esterase